MNKENTAEILFILEHNPVLARRLADIVYGQLNRSTVTPALDGQDLLKILKTSGENFRKLLDKP